MRVAVTGGTGKAGQWVVRVLAEAGASVHLPQSELTPQRLGDAVQRLLSEDGTRDGMAERAKARGKPHAASEIVSNLLTLVN